MAPQLLLGEIPERQPEAAGTVDQEVRSGGSCPWKLAEMLLCSKGDQLCTFICRPPCVVFGLLQGKPWFLQSQVV